MYLGPFYPINLTILGWSAFSSNLLGFYSEFLRGLGTPYLMKKYSLSDPCAKLAELNLHMCNKQTGHEWQNVILTWNYFCLYLRMQHDILFLSFFHCTPSLHYFVLWVINKYIHKYIIITCLKLWLPPSNF